MTNFKVSINYLLRKYWTAEMCKCMPFASDGIRVSNLIQNIFGIKDERNGKDGISITLTELVVNHRAEYLRLTKLLADRMREIAYLGDLKHVRASLRVAIKQYNATLADCSSPHLPMVYTTTNDNTPWRMIASTNREVARHLADLSVKHFQEQYKMRDPADPLIPGIAMTDGILHSRRHPNRLFELQNDMWVDITPMYKLADFK